MAFEVSPNRGTGRIRLSSRKKSPGLSNGLRGLSTTDSSRDLDGTATVIRWFPLAVPLLALLPTLTVYFIAWRTLVNR